MTTVQIFVPSTIHNQAAPIQIVNKWRRLTKSKLALLFGGFTEYRAVGGYWSEALQELIEEKVYIIESFTDNVGFEDIRQFCAEMALAMSQECILLKIADEVEFIAPMIPQTV